MEGGGGLSSSPRLTVTQMQMRQQPLGPGLLFKTAIVFLRGRGRNDSVVTGHKDKAIDIPLSSQL